MKTWLLVILLSSISLGIHAQMVAGWDVNGVDVEAGIGIETSEFPFVFHATTTDVEHVSAQLSLGAGVLPSTGNHQYGFKISEAVATESLAAAIDADHYIELSLVVDEGYALNLSALEMRGEGSPTACSNMVVMSSLDGFVAGQEIATSFPANKTGGLDTDASGFGAPVDLSDSRYQGLTGLVRFRLYGWNSTSGSGTTRLRDLSGHDLVVSGTVSALQNGGPQLAIQYTNNAYRVSATFDHPATQNYLLQHRGGLTDSNGWFTVSAPFSSNLNVQISDLNGSGFYRTIPE